ncbi:Skp family chaperone for outer membrane proteins [Dongia mobilis]|uniref:Skp family chaperone for outer membrane proteins n=1 Tax=Dongia mobilis TaxID=578943 RepID=A0A4R6WUB8_9PROT|nr:OmpH family outer membrane protein [Dongia mobilis]TDQ80518.1 Skp family chaperone for outer membrane proteins [Dongia mobilis]
MIKIKSLIKVAIAVAVAAALWLPSLPSSAQDSAAIPVLVGIVDVQKVIASSAAGQSLQKQAEQRRSQIQNDLVAKEKQLRAESDQLNAQRAQLAPADFQKQALALQEKLKAWRQEGEQKRKGFEKSYNDAQKTIFQTLQKVIGEIAVQRKLTLVLNKSVVIVSAQAWDITDSALAQLNKVLPSVKM